MRALALIGVMVLTSGCLQDLGPAGDVLARDAAKGVVNTYVSARFPGVNAAPFTDCIIENASGAEIVQIAQAAVVGTTPATTELLGEIAGRPDTIRCYASNSPGLGGLNL